MDVFNVSTFVFVILVIVKMIVYHSMKRMYKQTWFIERLCVNGFYGYVADPFNCDAYYKCPEGLKFYCDIGTQFDGDKSVCVPVTSSDFNGCYNTAARRLLD